jgi:WD40 repeat protein
MVEQKKCGGTIAMMSRHLLLALLIVIQYGTCNRVNAQANTSKENLRFAWFPSFSHNDRYVLSSHGGWDRNDVGRAIVWNVSDGSIKLSIPQKHGLRSAVWSTNDDFIMVGGFGNSANSFDVSTGKELTNTILKSPVESLRILSDDKRLICTLPGTGAMLCELPSMKQLRAWRGLHTSGVWGLAVSRDEKLFATAGQDGLVVVLDLKSFEAVNEFSHSQPTVGVAFSNDNRFLLTGCRDGFIRVFGIESGKEEWKEEVGASGSVTDLQFSIDGKLLVSAGVDGVVKLWEFNDVGNVSLKLKSEIQAHDGTAHGVALSRDGKHLASAGWDNTVKLWKLDTLKEVWTADANSN